MTNESATAPVAAIWRGGEPVYDRGETVCVIGAGASGLTAIKNLRERGFAVDCYERETSVGGGWNARGPHGPGLAAGHLVTSRVCTQFPDFPMPDDWPDYPSHAQAQAYLERYADHFGLREHIWFGTQVVRVEPVEGTSPRWDVTISGQRGGSSRIMRYMAVVIANGHHTVAHLPRYEGQSTFQGRTMHASEIQDTSQLRGKRVLIVGAGNAGCELAVEAASNSAKVWHSSRRGYWYIPKYVFGRPADQMAVRLATVRMPRRVRRAVAERALRLAAGDPTRFGLAAPDHGVGQTHPIITGRLFELIGHGGVVPVPDISRFNRSEVTLTDGRIIEPEIVVFATGYVQIFEFLDPGVLHGVEGRPALRWHLLSPDRPTLAVVGLIQPDTNALACAHWQSVLVAAWLRALDTAEDRARAFWSRHAAEDHGAYQDVRALDTSRHWFEVNHLVYLRALERALNDLEAVR